MMKIRTALFPWLLALTFLVATDGFQPKTVRAETHTASALTPGSVWDAINAAKDGDIVQLPEGTAVWKHGWNSGHWAKMKAITVRAPESTRRSFAPIQPQPLETSRSC